MVHGTFTDLHCQTLKPHNQNRQMLIQGHKQYELKYFGTYSSRCFKNKY